MVTAGAAEVVSEAEVEAFVEVVAGAKRNNGAIPSKGDFPDAPGRSFNMGRYQAPV